MTEETMTVATYSDYEDFVTRLGSPFTMENECSKAGTAGLGLAGEAGEVAAIVVDLMAENDADELPEAWRLKLIDELGDIMWYVAFTTKNVIRTSLQATVDIYGDVDSLSKTYPVRALRVFQPQLTNRCCAVSDIIKKVLYHGKPFNDDVREKIKENLGSIVSLVTMMAKDVCRVELKDVIDRNVAKLSERYKSLQFTVKEFMDKESGQNV